MMKRIPIAAIYGNPDQPRKTFNPAELEELADSIRENGLLQPITVRADGAGRYMIVMGERRWRAYGLNAVREPGFWTEILCQVSRADDEQLAINAIVENDQRADVAPLEQAYAYQRMIDEHGFSIETLAKKLGKPEWRIKERTNLLTLSEETLQLLKLGHLTTGHTWYLVQMNARQQAMLIRAIRSGSCETSSQLKVVFEAIMDGDAQSALFDLCDAGPTEEERKAAATFEAHIEKISALLRGAIDGNQVVTAVRRVNPGRASTVADLLKHLQTDVKRLEMAFRVAAAGNAIQEG